MHHQTLILIQCQDAVGLVANISNVLAQHQLNIVTMREFVDEKEHKFFVRVACSGVLSNQQKLQQDLQAQLPKNTLLSINPDIQKKLVILVTKEHHCLADILVRHFFKTLQAEVVAVIGNYDTLKILPINFKFLSITSAMRKRAKKNLKPSWLNACRAIKQTTSFWLSLCGFCLQILCANLRENSSTFTIPSYRPLLVPIPINRPITGV